MLIAEGWRDYELLDAGGGEKLERWGAVRVVRPDPQIIWPRAGGGDLWRGADMFYRRSASGGGHWETPRGETPKSWRIAYGDLRFHIRPTDFKHMGLFPEQAANWRWVTEKINAARGPARVLNLFAYTGGATVACLAAGADVTHVDAAKGMNQWAKENIALSGLSEKKHRVLTDDVMKFVNRETRRRSFYDAVIMDPPVFGRGPSGEVWKLEDKLFDLLTACAGLLSGRPLFMLLNAYTSGLSPAVAENMLKIIFNKSGKINCGEIGLRAALGGTVLPCGIYGRWEA